MHKFLVITSDDNSDAIDSLSFLKTEFELIYIKFKNELFTTLKNRTDINIIILDITSNKLSTLDICRQIRALQLVALQIPILVLKRPSYKLQFENIDYVHVIDNPIDPKELYTTLVKLDTGIANILKKAYLI